MEPFSKRKTGGIAMILFSIIQGVRFAIQTAGDIDFIVTRVDEPGWLKAFAITVFVDPPWWLVLAALLLGTVLLAWSHGGQKSPPVESVPPPEPTHSSLKGRKALPRPAEQRRDYPAPPATTTRALEVLGVLPHNGKVLLDSLALEPRQVPRNERGALGNLTAEGLVEIAVQGPLGREVWRVPSHIHPIVTEFFGRTVSGDNAKAPSTTVASVVGVVPLSPRNAAPSDSHSVGMLS